MGAEIPVGEASEAKAYRVPSVEKCFEILHGFHNGMEELSLGDIVRGTGIQKTTAFRILCTLEAIHYVSRNPDTGRYRLGARTVDLAARFFSERGIAEICRPPLGALVRAFGETASLALRRGNQLIYAAIVESSHSLRMVATVGEVAPLHATALGKAVASCLSSTELDTMVLQHDLPSYTSHTITHSERLKEELASVKAQGYSVDNEEAEPGASCVGAPILGYLSQPVGAISVSGPTVRLLSRRDEIIASVKQTAAHLSSQFGFLFFLSGEVVTDRKSNFRK